MKYIRYVFFILTLFLLTPAVTIILALLRIFNLAWTFGGHISKFWANVLLFSSGVKVQIFGMENIHPHNKYIFISNHLSHFDSVILQGKLPSKYRFLAKRELFRIPFFGWALSLAGHIKVDRGEGSLQKILDQAKNVLEKKGASIHFFAESTRSTDGMIYPFKPGAFILARETGVPIIPMGILGTRDVLPKGALLPRPAHAIISVGKPFQVSDDGSRLTEILENARKTVAALSGQELGTTRLKSSRPS